MMGPGMMSPNMMGPGMMSPNMMGPGMMPGMMGQNLQNKNNPETKMVNSKEEKIDADKAIVYDVDGDKIDLRTIQAKKNKPCKKNPITCATINLKKMIDQKTKLYQLKTVQWDALLKCLMLCHCLQKVLMD